MSIDQCPCVNAWTQWGRLETVVVGRADSTSCHLPHEPACRGEINDPYLAENIPWPGGSVKHEVTIQRAAAQLDNLCAVLEAESIQVQDIHALDTELKREVAKKRTLIVDNPEGEDQDRRLLRKGRIATSRTQVLDWSKPVAGPEWSSPSQYCATCPRDTIITLGNTILEATMSKRSRYFEHLACRDIALSLWRADPLRIKFLCCPKPSLANDMYHQGFFDMSDAERFQQMRSYQFCVNEKEPVFDAADITRVGKDIFVQKSMTTNDSGIQWIAAHFPDLRVHAMHFPYDLYPSHIDCTFVPLRPPSNDGGDGLALINPERPPLQSESELWKKNGWKFLNAPLPAQFDRPAFSQSSYWLCMNLLSLSEDSMVIEENEIPLYDILTEHGFDPITVPMRHMYEFGGAIHCCTWDLRRQDTCKDYFPEQEFDRMSLFRQKSFDDIKVLDVSSSSDGFLLNPSSEYRIGTKANVLMRRTDEACTNGKAYTNGKACTNGHALSEACTNGKGTCQL
jgi:glycine amidinotransferase